MHILDGGLATTLQNLGYPVNGNPLWSAYLLHKDPGAIKNVHKVFFEHGADVAISSSYQASIEGFEEHLSLDSVSAKDLIKESVTIAKKAVEEFSSSNGQEQRELLVAGSVGPYGACLHDGSEYNGCYRDSISAVQLKEWHRPRLECLIEAGADLIAVETQPIMEEALALIQLLREHPNKKYWISFACKDGARINCGDSFGDAVTTCASYGRDQIMAIGVNCTAPMDVQPLLASAKQALKENKISPVPFVVYPNSGEMWDTDKGWYGKEQSAPLHQFAVEWASEGAEWIGGCCQTTPQDIQLLRKTLLNSSS